MSSGQVRLVGGVDLVCVDSMLLGAFLWLMRFVLGVHYAAFMHPWQLVNYAQGT